MSDTPDRPRREAHRRTLRMGRRGQEGAVPVTTLGLVLGVVALVLGGSALGIALTGSGHAGPTGPAGAIGPAGATGAQGPAGSNGANGKNGANGTNGAPGAAGPGAIVAQAYSTGTTLLTPNCTYYVRDNVTFTVSGPGTVVLTGSITMAEFHTAGYSAGFDVSFWNTTSTCRPFSNHYVIGAVETSTPSGSYYPVISLAESYPIATAGTYTFAVIGVAIYSSGSTDLIDFYYGSVVGVFYPS